MNLKSIIISFLEPLKFRVPHAFLNFTVGGRVIYVNPENSVSTIRMDDVKTFIKDRIVRRNIEALESFKGVLFILSKICINVLIVYRTVKIW